MSRDWLSYLGQQGGHVFLRRKIEGQDVQGLAGGQGGGLSYLGQQGGHVFLRRKIEGQDVQGLAGGQCGTVILLLCVFIIILNTMTAVKV